MAIIRIPKPPQSAINKDRPISSLLQNQIRHLQETEFRLPARAQTNIYINAIKTEGEAAEYIKQVTARLHAEHGAAVKPARKRKEQRKAGPKFAIAAVAKNKPTRKRKPARKSKSSRKSY